MFGRTLFFNENMNENMDFVAPGKYALDVWLYFCLEYFGMWWNLVVLIFRKKSWDISIVVFLDTNPVVGNMCHYKSWKFQWNKKEAMFFFAIICKTSGSFLKHIEEDFVEDAKLPVQGSG